MKTTPQLPKLHTRRKDTETLKKSDLQAFLPASLLPKDSSVPELYIGINLRSPFITSTRVFS
jgi:hypothetical protein